MKVRGNEGRVHRHGALRDGRPVLVLRVSARRPSPPFSLLLESLLISITRSQSKDHRTRGTMCMYTWGERKRRASPYARSRAHLSHTCSERDLSRMEGKPCRLRRGLRDDRHGNLPLSSVFFFSFFSFRLWSAPPRRGACKATATAGRQFLQVMRSRRGNGRPPSFPHVFLFPPQLPRFPD